MALLNQAKERYYEELKKEIPEVDLFIPIRDYDKFNKLLYSLDNSIDSSLGVDDEYRIVSTGPYSAYLKIGEGCDNRCSYCAIPIIRGHFVSRDMASIIKEAKDLASNGIKEVVVLPWVPHTLMVLKIDDNLPIKS